MSTLDSQVAQIKEQLLAAMCQKADAEAQVAKTNETIHALRNALTGIQLAVQMTAEAAKPTEAPTTP